MLSVLERVRRLAAERSVGDDDLAAIDRALGSAGVAPGDRGFAARRRDELLAMVADGQVDRAVVLCREHVDQHPDDTVVVVLLEVLVTYEIDDGDTAARTSDDTHDDTRNDTGRDTLT